MVRVQTLCRSDEAHTETGECRQLLAEIEDRSAKSVQLPYHHAVELPLGGIGHEAVKGRAACLRTRKPGVHVLTGDLPVTAGNVFPKFPQLQIAMLIRR